MPETNPETIFKIIQASASIGYFFFLYIIFKQLKIANHALKASELTQRRQSFAYLQESMSEEQIKTMMLHRYSHFEEKVYQERYKDHKERIASYLLMKKKYFHYYNTLMMNEEKKNSDPKWRIPEIWINEQAVYQEFRDVHERHKRYFIKYAQRIEDIIKTLPLEGWACEK